MVAIHDRIEQRYELLEIIGQGGMADVYRCYDHILNREAAIKILRSSLSSDALYVSRFHREASATTKFIHRNVVQVYDVGNVGDVYYMVMEYVNGPTLKELIFNRGSLHLTECLDIMRQLLDGIGAAHKHGIIHRDIKPQNILMTNSGILKIADFGIAVIDSYSDVTRTQTVMGSLHYLAPELIRGEKASPQSDIYSLGIIFYELLRGKVPFNDDVAMNIAKQHLTKELPSIRSFNPSIPQSIENVIYKATAKNLENRYKTCEDMLYDIEMALKYPDQEKIVFENEEDDQPTIVVETMTEPVEEKKQPPKTNKKKKKIGLVLMLIVLVLSLTAFLYYLLAPKTVIMPNIQGKTLAQAKKILEPYALVINEDLIIEENSEIYEVGEIIKSSPKQGEKLKEGDKVVVSVSKGKAIKLDNYVGMPIDKAQAALKDLGFEVTVEYMQSETYDEDTVMWQSIRHGAVFDSSASLLEITLRVSSGYQILVDSVVGSDIESARKILELKGLKVKTEILPEPTTLDEIQKMKVNVVIKQDYENETITSSDTVITLYYYDHLVELDTSNNQESQGDADA